MAEKTPWQDRIIGFSRENPQNFLANPFNFRLHAKTQKALMNGMLAEVGWVQAVVVNKTTGHIVDGHMRVTLADERNEESVPTIWVSLTEDEEKKVLATFDPIGSFAFRANDIYQTLVEQLDAEDEALKAFLDSVKKIPTRAQVAIVDSPAVDEDELEVPVIPRRSDRGQQKTKNEVLRTYTLSRSDADVIDAALGAAMQLYNTETEALVHVCRFFLDRN